MGAGDVYKLKNKLSGMINNKSSSFAKASEDKGVLRVLGRFGTGGAGC